MVKFCKHCKQVNLTKDPDFCCNGCAGAFKLVKELSLDSFYSYRPKNIINHKVDLDSIPVLKHSFIIDNNNGTKTINLVAEGLECAACCWLIENALLKLKGLESVKISLVSKKIIITFKNSLKPEDIIYRIFSLGYKVYPYSHSLAEEMHEKKKKDLLMKMSVAAFFCMNIMLFSVSMWFGGDLTAEIEQLFKVLSFILAIPAVIYSAREFFDSAIKSLKQKSTNMDVAISVAIILSFTYSIYHTFIGDGEIYFESTLMLIFFLLVGRFLEFKTKERISLLTENLILADIKQTTVFKNSKTIDIDSQNLKKGDIIILQKGEKLATDAVLIDSLASFDISSTTGELKPLEVGRNQEVYAGSILLSNTVKLQAINSFKDNSISQIIKIIEQANLSKGTLQDLAEKIAKMYVPVVHVIAFFSFILAFFVFNTGAESAISRAIAVLIITCPCALALAIPVANTALLSRLFDRGILVKNTAILENLSEIKNICYDKTGTLVSVDLELPKLSSLEKKVLKSLTLNSKHILSKKISQQLTDVDFVELEDFQEKEGFGVSAIHQYAEYSLGSAEFCRVYHEDSLIFKAGNKIYSIKIKQSLNSNVKSTLQGLKKQGFKQFIVSGDIAQNVKEIASKIGINYRSKLKPVEKVKFIEQINGKTIYLGDGINDAGALAVADISISFAKANQIAQNSADIIMQNNDFSNLQYLYDQSLDSQLRIKQNLVISLAYNVLAIPFAIFGFVSPFFAALLMSSSSICVILNTIRK